MLFSKPEVLAPAGSRESMVAAVRSGADAVYMGAKQFSARRNAENFDEKELKEAVEFCRVRGVKVYLTLNIMIKDSELHDALAVVEHAYRCGIDGIIIADLGLAKIVHSAFPNLPLHASTQMTVHSPSALYELKSLGISRVVAAREMSKQALADLCATAKELDMEIEAFVHGALCMCVSGQCLLSSVIGGRSGNRGLCAGPCRLPFKVSGGTGYDLSLKDLSLYEYIGELSKMGVASLKIEGRMKRPEYIASATAACRRAVDEGAVPEDLSEILVKVFSRSGFTSGYYTETLGRNMFGVRTDEDAASSKDTYSYIHNLYRAERQNVGVSISAVIKAGEDIRLEISDGKNKVSAIGNIPQVALSKEATKEDVSALLSKLGGTPYFAKNMYITLDGGLFVPASEMNALRRECIEKLNALRAQIPPISKEEYQLPSIINNKSGKTEIYIRITEPSQIPEDLSKVSCLIVPLEIAATVPILKDITMAIDIPRWIDDEDEIFKKLLELKQKGFTAAYCSNLAAINLAKKTDLKIIGGIGLNVCNEQTARVLGEMGVSDITLSAEIGMRDAVNFATEHKKGIFAYGRIPLMMFKNCPVKNGMSCAECKKGQFLTDRKGLKFPVRCRAGYSEMFNCNYLYLGDKQQDINNFDYLLLYFTDETSDKVTQIINDYQNGATAPTDYTRGLYYRNLL